jgi:hypothetical protein
MAVTHEVIGEMIHTVEQARRSKINGLMAADVDADSRSSEFTGDGLSYPCLLTDWPTGVGDTQASNDGKAVTVLRPAFCWCIVHGCRNLLRVLAGPRNVATLPGSSSCWRDPSLGHT